MSQKPGQVADGATFATWLVGFNALETIACEVVDSETATPGVTDDDYDLGTKWIKKDTNEAFVLVHTTVTNDAVWLARGSTPGALLNTGLVPLIANWDAGDWQIRAKTFHADQPDTGTAPFVIDSTTLNTNLNADMVDGIEGAEFIKREVTTVLTGNWDVGVICYNKCLQFCI